MLFTSTFSAQFASDHMQTAYTTELKSQNLKVYIWNKEYKYHICGKNPLLCLFTKWKTKLTVRLPTDLTFI